MKKATPRLHASPPMPNLNSQRPLAIRAQAGFSLIELAIVVTIIGIMSGISILALLNSKKAYRTEDQALSVIDFMRDAGQRAISRRRTMHFEINLTTKRMSIIDGQNTVSTTDDKVVRSQVMEDSEALRFAKDTTYVSQPGNITVLPPSPANYPAAAFVNKNGQRVWTTHFKSNGEAADDLGIPTSTTLMFWLPDAPTNLNNAVKPATVRAITLFGGTGSIGYWKYSGTAFLAN